MEKYFHGLTMDKLENAYDHYLRCLCYDEIINRLSENDYLVNKGIENLNEKEIEVATDILRQTIAGLIDEIDWGLHAMYAIDDVVAKRLKEATKPLCQYDKTLAEYGLKPHDEFMVANVLGFTDTLYVFNETGRLCYYNFTGETFQPSGHDLADFLIRVSPRDIVRTSLTDLIRSKEKPKDLLNETLKKIGLETFKPFSIGDTEFGDILYHVDSFGDVYVIDEDGEEGELSEALTLGRILTQYPDKIKPVV